MQFLLTWLPEFDSLFDLFSDFRGGGYRVLSDLLCDILQEMSSRRDGNCIALETHRYLTI